ncbi:glycan biosynthesis hexose transferase WsfD [Cohnella fermenti]|uniref:Glycosyltransferase RgtA/B/C/D-like domain-containing protein n=1 Tax=Cohnella fermenti TaxID=2565925 RepID=A0A4V3WE14_9BACL|nr:hypothetical protein [Cohnella fermenti]THF74461.1 hypothetical protein E6C55_24875 [Cohnella fermenti]
MNRNPNRSEDDVRLAVGRAAALIACLLIVVLMMIPPIVGVADNGDFARVMGASGIKPLDPAETYGARYFYHTHSHYAYGSYGTGGYVSTHVLLVALSGLLSRFLLEPIYDIRSLGLLYAIALLAALTLLIRHLPSLRSRRATALLALTMSLILLLVFCDIGYLAYFQSFFGEPYAMVGLLLAVAAALALAESDSPPYKLLVLFVCAALAVATAKIQYAPLGLLFAVLAWRMQLLKRTAGWRQATRAGALVLAVGTLAMMAAAPHRLVHTNLYQSIFYGVLKDSPSLADDLRELGIPPKYGVLAGTNYFQQDTVIPQRDPTLEREVLSRLSHRTVAAFYAEHPWRLIDKMKKAAREGTAIRPYYLGNYGAQSGKPKGAIDYRFSAWSEFKHDRMPNRLGWFFAIYAGYMAIVGAGWLRSRAPRARLAFETLGAVAVCGAFSFVIPLIGDGEADLGKHLFLFNVTFDMMLIVLVFAVLYGLGRKLEQMGRAEVE